MAQEIDNHGNLPDAVNHLDQNRRDQNRRGKVDWLAAARADCYSAPPTELSCATNLEQALPQQNDTPNLTRTFMPNQFARLGAFAALWALAMRGRSIDVSRRGTDNQTAVTITIHRPHHNPDRPAGPDNPPDAPAYTLPNCQLQVGQGQDLTFTLSQQGNDLLVQGIRGMTIPDDDNVRRPVTSMRISRRAGGGLQYEVHFTNGAGQDESLILRFENTSAYSGLSDLLRRVRQMQP
jgi:hypothetical protein